MAEKNQKAVVQERPKKVSDKRPPEGRIEAVGTRSKGGPKESPKDLAARARDARKAQHAKKIARIKLATARQKSVITQVQPLTLEDVTMTVEDPGLKDAMQFSERLRTGESRILSPEESKAAWEESDRQMADLQRLVAQKFGGPKP